MIRQQDVYKIGRIGKPHGIKGELNFLFDDDVFDRVEADYLILEVDGILVPFFIEEYRWRSDGHVLLKLCDIDTQERARELTAFSRADRSAPAFSASALQGQCRQSNRCLQE